MPKIVYVTSSGEEITVEAVCGDNVMRMAVANDVPGIVAECGGAAVCATCHVYVEGENAAYLPPIGEVEDEMLESAMAPRTKDSRLSCQLLVPEGLEMLIVRVPEAQI